MSQVTLDTLRSQVNEARETPLTETQLQAFAQELDALKKEVQAKIGPDDVVYIETVYQICRLCEVTGRLLLHTSRDPVSWGLGVLFLYVYLQLDNLELHHHAQHGAYDKLPEARRFHSDVYWHNSSVDEESWRYRHNVLHHSYTGQVDRDPDVTYGYYRLSELIDKQVFHTIQPAVLVLNTLGAEGSLGLVSSGLLDFMMHATIPGYEKLNYPSVNKSHDLQALADSLRRHLRKAVPHYAYNYGLFALLAGHRWPQVTLGNLTAALLRNVFTGLIFYTGHMTEQVKHYDWHPSNRAEWYLQQIEGTANVAGSRLFSLLAGHLNYQIEHHLFPKLPPNRLEEIAPKVQAICERYGVNYNTGSFVDQVASVFRRITRYSR
jgi:fatty acid desaturase